MTVSLVENVALGIANAYATRLAVDTLGKGSYNLLSANDPDAVIKALFAAGEQGAWYDPSDLTTMFQDRAGTTPVTADGQTVGKILDKSGNDNHAIAPIDADRPLYKASGGLHWLQFDGVDDHLQTAAIDFSSIKQVTAFVGDSIATNTGWLQLFQFGAVVTATGSFGIYMPYFGTDGAMFAYPSSAANTQSAQWTNSGVNVKEVLALLLNNPAATRQIVARKNASEVAALNGSAYDSGFSNLTFTIGANGVGGECCPCNIYSLVVRGAASTTQQLTDAEEWVNGKTGAY